MFQGESRIVILETLIKDAVRAIRELLGRVARLENKGATSGGGSSGGGGGGGAFFADHLNIAGATGLLSAPPALASPATGVSVYVLAGGVVTLLPATGTVYNPMPDPTDSTKRQILGLNPDGTYSVITQSCTTV